jgi:hypothetical protein
MKLLLTSLLAFLIAVLSQSSLACKCLGEPEYDAVFEGRVDNIKTNIKDHYNEVRLSVTRVTKGAIAQEITIFTPMPVVLCGVPFEVGKSYVVYANFLRGRFETMYCYGTKEK